MYYLKTGNYKVKYYKLPELTEKELEKVVTQRFIECMAMKNIKIIDICRTEDKWYLGDHCFEVTYQYKNSTSTVTSCSICFTEVTEEEYIEHLLE